MPRQHVHFSVNGQLIEVGGDDIFAPLSDTLRYRLRKTGTKVVCAEGDCGACTVMLKRLTARDGEFRGINSCIFPTFLADGCHLVTVEGLAQNGEPNETQTSMMRNFGGQCGFCTPGFVMAMTDMFEHKSSVTEQNIKNHLTGNLCRCTGYQPIIQAAKDVNLAELKRVRDLYPLKTESQELLGKTAESIAIETESRSFHAPATLSEAREIMKRAPQTRLFSGATDIGVQINKGKSAGARQMSLHLIESLYLIEIKGDNMRVGARATLAQLQEICKTVLPAFAEFLNIFASPQIKHSATLVGNVANGSPIADTTPFLLAADCEVELLGPAGPRQIELGKFIKGYKSFDLREGEFITALLIPLVSTRDAKVGLYKVSQRRDLDISCVNSCFIVREKNGNVASVAIAYGGVGPVVKRLRETEAMLKGRALSRELIARVQKSIAKEISPISDVRGSAEFRTQISQQLFNKFASEHLGL